MIGEPEIIVGAEVEHCALARVRDDADASALRPSDEPLALSEPGRVDLVERRSDMTKECVRHWRYCRRGSLRPQGASWAQRCAIAIPLRPFAGWVAPCRLRHDGHGDGGARPRKVLRFPLFLPFCAPEPRENLFEFNLVAALRLHRLRRFGPIGRDATLAIALSGLHAGGSPDRREVIRRYLPQSISRSPRWMASASAVNRPSASCRTSAGAMRRGAFEPLTPPTISRCADTPARG